MIWNFYVCMKVNEKIFLDCLDGVDTVVNNNNNNCRHHYQPAVAQNINLDTDTPAVCATSDSKQHKLEH